MKLSFILSSLWMSGGVNVIVEYANRLADRGYECSLIAPKDSMHDEVEALLGTGVDIIFSTVGRTESPKTIDNFKLIYALAAATPNSDVVLATHTPTTTSTFLASHLMKKGVPIWLFADYAEMFAGRPLEGWLLRNGLRWHRGAMTLSNKSQMELSSYASGHVEYIGLGLSLQGRPAEVRPISTPTAQKTILYVGDMRPRKGLIEFIAASEKLSQRLPNLHLWIVSKDECQIDTIVPHTFFHRPSNKTLIELYQSSDLFVSTSWREGFGLPPLEAMACGCPVVTTNSGGITQFARDGENCLIVPVKDQAKLVVAMQQLLSSPEQVERLTKSGLKTARFFDWESATDRFEQNLHAMLHTH